MTTYLDIQVSGSHMFPIVSPWESRSIKSQSSYIGRLLAKIESTVADIQTKQKLRALPDHLLQDIGIERHNFDW